MFLIVPSTLFFLYKGSSLAQIFFFSIRLLWLAREPQESCCHCMASNGGYRHAPACQHFYKVLTLAVNTFLAATFLQPMFLIHPKVVNGLQLPVFIYIWNNCHTNSSVIRKIECYVIRITTLNFSWVPLKCTGFTLSPGVRGDSHMGLVFMGLTVFKGKKGIDKLNP